MSDIVVSGAGTLTFEGKTYRCAIGKNGFVSGDARKEGSLTTPIGRFALRECWYRPDRVTRPATILSLREITPQDGWCDDASHPDYNKPVKLPFSASHEKLWRDDQLYDIVVPLGFNDSPVIPGKGSAIFMHIAKPDYEPTEGCVALALEDMLSILGFITDNSMASVAPRK